MCRVVITGHGAVSAFGLGASVLWQNVREGRGGIRPLDHAESASLRVSVAAQVPHFDAASHFDEKQLPLLDRFTQFALLAAREAVTESGIDFSVDGLAERTAVIVGSAVGGELTRDEQSRRLYAEQSTRMHPLTIPRAMINAPSSHISMEHGLTGPAFAVASACASSNHAIAQAVQTIRSGLADAAIAGGTEACFSVGNLRAWEAMFVLESLEHAQARGAVILAELAGFGMSSDAGDIVAPSDVGAARSMRQALANAKLGSADIDYINAHGTGTQANDATETRAIRNVFGADANRLAVSSTKSMHGHALGASGALELIAVIGALRDGIVPPTANYTDPDPACDLDVVPNVARSMPVRAALTNSFAFGGLNSTLVLRRAS